MIRIKLKTNNGRGKEKEEELLVSSTRLTPRVGEDCNVEEANACEEEKEEEDVANLTKKNVEMSFKTTTPTTPASTKTPPVAFNDILNINYNNSTDYNNNCSNSTCTSPSCFYGSKELGRGDGDKEDVEMENTSHKEWEWTNVGKILLSLVLDQNSHPQSPLKACFDVRQLVLLTSFAFLVLLNFQEMTVCFAQKLVFGKNHNNPLLQQTTNVVIPHIKYGQGLNRWSFLSVDRDNHGLHSDLLCPNPMMTSSSLKGYNNRGGGGGGGVTARVNPGRGGNKQQQQSQTTYQQQSRFPGGQIGSASSSSSQHHPTPVPNEIWAVKTDDNMSLLPCSLRQYAVPPPFSSPGVGGNGGMILMNRGGGGRGGGGGGRHNNGHFIENRILYVNVSLVPFNFHGAIPCSKYIKLMYDEEEGTNLRCGDIPFDPRHDNKYHINWPSPRSKRKEYFSLLDNLERFLQNEPTFRRQFYFQIYFTSHINGHSKRCTVQQYELDLSFPAGNSRFCNLSNSSGTTGAGHEELCGEFHCEDLIFPLYTDPQPNTGVHHGGGGGGHGDRHRGKGARHRESSVEDDIYGDEEDYDDDLEDTSMENDNLHGGKNKGGSSLLGQTHEGRDQEHQQDQGHETFSWIRMIKTDKRLLIFFTIVPLVLFGVLVFGLELIVHLMCCRKRQDEDEEGGGRSQQLLENSLNVWENVPSRMDAQRTVSFSPMTTSIYGGKLCNMQMADAASLESHPETPKILKSALKAAKSGGDHGSPTTAAHHYFDYHDHDMPPSYIETTSR